MEKALRKSQKEERRAAKRKAKEEKELEDVLELSRIETEKERQKCASMMLELRSSAVSIPPKLEVLGLVEEMERFKGRTCPFSGASECDPNIEEKDLDPQTSPCFPSHSPRFPSDPHSPDAPSQSKDSGNVDTLEVNNGTDESLDSDLTKLLEEP